MVIAIDFLLLILQTQVDKYEIIPRIKSTISGCYYTLNSNSLEKEHAAGDFDRLIYNFM